MVDGLPSYSSMRIALTGQALAASTACGTSSGGIGLGHGQRAFHLEHGGAKPGALGAANAQIRVNICVHRKTSF